MPNLNFKKGKTRCTFPVIYKGECVIFTGTESKFGYFDNLLDAWNCLLVKYYHSHTLSCNLFHDRFSVAKTYSVSVVSKTVIVKTTIPILQMAPLLL